MTTTCKTCGATNRTPDLSRGFKRLRCGRCKTALPYDLGGTLASTDWGFGEVDPWVAPDWVWTSLGIVFWTSLCAALLGFGWQVTIMTGLIGGALFAAEKTTKWTHERHRRVAPCSHGINGAEYDLSKCVVCTDEENRRQAAALKEAEERAETERQLRRRKWAERVRELRLPEFLRKMHPEKFEKLVCEIFARKGYQVEPTRYTGDGGVDGYIRRAGQTFLLQCKRVQGSVGEPVLRDLFGTIHHEKANGGIVVTTGSVSEKARAWAKEKPIKIVEMSELQEMIAEVFREDEVVPDSFVAESEEIFESVFKRGR